MNAQSTTQPTPTAVPDHLRDLYRNLRCEAEQIVAKETADWKAATEQRAAQEAAQRAEKWAPAIARIKEAVPPALHEFIRQPKTDYTGYESGPGVYFNPLLITPPGVTPIYAWCERDGVTMNFEAAQYRAVHEDEDGPWVVTCTIHERRRYHWNTTQRPFSVAFLDALAHERQRPVVEADAARRNELAAQPEADLTPEQETELDRMKREQAAALLFNSAESDVLAAGLLLIVNRLDNLAASIASFDRTYGAAHF